MDVVDACAAQGKAVEAATRLTRDQIVLALQAADAGRFERQDDAVKELLELWEACVGGPRTPSGGLLLEDVTLHVIHGSCDLTPLVH